TLRPRHTAWSQPICPLIPIFPLILVANYQFTKLAASCRARAAREADGRGTRSREASGEDGRSRGAGTALVGVSAVRAGGIRVARGALVDISACRAEYDHP